MKLVGILAYFLVLILIGAIASRRMRDLREYFAGGKRFGYWAAAFSARATGESAWLLLGLTGMGAAIGAQAFWVVLGEILGVGGAWLLMCRRFKNLTDRYDSITIPDYLESRFRDFGHLIRLVAAGSLVVFVTIYVSAQIDATGQAFESFFKDIWLRVGFSEGSSGPYFIGALIGFAVVMIYIISGGFVAVVWSDVFQGVLMFFGLVSLPIVGLIYAGGIGPVAEGLRAIDPGLLTLGGPDGWSLSTVLCNISLVCIGLGFLGSPQVFVRFLALRSPREVGPGAAVAITWTLLADTGAVLSGMVGRHLLTSPGQNVVEVLGNNAEAVVPNLTELLLSPLLVGLAIAIVLAAIMSTIDSLLVVASSAAVRDYYQKTFHPDMHDDALVGMSRVATFVLALIALAIALVVAATVEGRTIFWFVIFGWSGIAATFCPTIILSLFWSRFTARGALAAMISGFACVPIFKFAAPHLPGTIGPAFGNLGELPPSFAVSMLAGVIVSLVDRPGRERMASIETELSDAART